MAELTLFQTLVFLTAAAVSAAIIINALFDVYFPHDGALRDWSRWGPLD
ncbi:hypothetical protein [Pseudorhodobacter sp.]|nr:hypothetical protein [Pseudorhodobacter sp.]MDN5788409.1 hypothetical protein [Pseudorhodobacter sp.]